ncbi:DUF4062 domain-containing protein [Sanguibacter suaedae]|uniref:DUF4062 domain-containing protein n=1 Tax=Sanguibacter suaedae TaxID=2795737 RepID=A0A934I9J9_9MICO|nr:DUF4062 domain-containing protein [Sanguibacter suaedae]MBI9115577.1 DUF4062 domain-containing protein [Sanguibacter suaedae]
MANFRVFVSSTAYDLGVLRSALRGFIEQLGYTAVLSEYSDVLYDPNEHTHKSCLAEVPNCDVVVLIIGSRFGSTLRPEVLEGTFGKLSTDFLTDAGSEISITQAEVLMATERRIPLFAFVEGAVYHDYFVYQQNKGKEFAAKISYPSIAQPESAEYIFRFIDFLQGRASNNAVIPFERLEEVTEHLRKQWAALFQRLLSESREEAQDARRIDRLADQFDDLKTALLATVGDSSNRAVARGVIRYRRLVDFLRSLPNSGTPMRQVVIEGAASFWDMLREAAGFAGLQEIDNQRNSLWNAVLYTNDGETYLSRLPLVGLERLERDWQAFRGLSAPDREVIFDAILDSDDRHAGYVRRASKDDIERLAGPTSREWLLDDETRVRFEAMGPLAPRVENDDEDPEPPRAAGA